jgi:murein peptide amidase A
MHRCHDYRFLLQRWRAVARTAGLRLQRIATAGKYEVFALRTPALRSDGGCYLSAGIHGDEPASSDALITWAERHAARLRGLPLLIFPCLNPWGLVNNSRFDETGADLNRMFHRDELPLIRGVKGAVGARRFSVALMLHEDYDAQGLYLYEVQRETPFWGESLLEIARPLIPIDGRTQVDGRKARAGVIRRRVEHRRFARIGYPEAIWLQMHHSMRTFTIETPSEFALEQRVAAHIAIIEECVRRATGLGAPLPAGDERE